MVAKLAVTGELMHIIARPRIHVSLADMGFASLRAFGGIGFSIEQPLTVFQFEQCSGIEIHGLEVLDDEGRADLIQVIERMKNDRGELRFRAVLKSFPPQHVGFGSKTALVLALIAGVNVFRSVGWSIEQDAKAQRTGRRVRCRHPLVFRGRGRLGCRTQSRCCKAAAAVRIDHRSRDTTPSGAHSVSGCLASDAGPTCRASNDGAGRNQIFR